MSEIKTILKTSQNEREAARIARRKELEPALSKLSMQAKATYSLLRPEAKDISEVGTDYPLRYKQIYGLGAMSLGHVVSDKLLVGFGNNHNLVIQQNTPYDTVIPWEISRSILIGNLREENTKVTELSIPNCNLYIAGRMSLDVSIIEYPNEVDVDGSRVDGPCNFYNDFDRAEEYIELLSADFALAVERFVK